MTCGAQSISSTGTGRATMGAAVGSGSAVASGAAVGWAAPSGSSAVVVGSSAAGAMVGIASVWPRRQATRASISASKTSSNRADFWRVICNPPLNEN